MSSYSDYTDDSDEEYPDLEISGWGAQKTNEGTTEVTVSAAGWGALIDPSVKMKSGGIGSGQLHRKGKNFIPVDEQLILDRRLGKPVPKGGLGGDKKKKKKKKGGKSGGLPPPSQSKLPAPQPKLPAPQPKLSAPSRPIPSTFNRGRPPIQPGSSAWATTALVETPFWEKPNGTSASKYADPVPQRQQPSWGQAQKTTPRQQPQQAPQQQPSWAQQQPQQPVQPPAQQPQTNWNSAPLQQQTNPSWNQHSFLGTSASKYASHSVVTQPPHPQQQQQQQQQQHQQPSAPLNPTAPCLTFKIELAPGVTANLPVYANDNPVDVVNDFEKNHHLVMSDAAKIKFAERVAMLLSQYKPN